MSHIGGKREELKEIEEDEIIRTTQEGGTSFFGFQRKNGEAEISGFNKPSKANFVSLIASYITE